MQAEGRLIRSTSGQAAAAARLNSKPLLTLWEPLCFPSFPSLINQTPLRPWMLLPEPNAQNGRNEGSSARLLLARTRNQLEREKDHLREYTMNR